MTTAPGRGVRLGIDVGTSVVKAVLSDGSVARTPVSRPNTASLQYPAVTARSSTSGSLRSSQPSRGAGAPGNSALPLTR